jgi:hypothetical protein
MKDFAHFSQTPHVLADSQQKSLNFANCYDDSIQAKAIV